MVSSISCGPQWVAGLCWQAAHGPGFLERSAPHPMPGAAQRLYVLVEQKNVFVAVKFLRMGRGATVEPCEIQAPLVSRCVPQPFTGLTISWKEHSQCSQTCQFPPNRTGYSTPRGPCLSLSLAAFRLIVRRPALMLNSSRSSHDPWEDRTQWWAGWNEGWTKQGQLHTGLLRPRNFPSKYPTSG